MGDCREQTDVFCKIDGSCKLLSVSVCVWMCVLMCVLMCVSVSVCGPACDEEDRLKRARQEAKSFRGGSCQNVEVCLYLGVCVIMMCCGLLD